MLFSIRYWEKKFFHPKFVWNFFQGNDFAAKGIFGHISLQKLSKILNRNILLLVGYLVVGCIFIGVDYSDNQMQS